MDIHEINIRRRLQKPKPSMYEQVLKGVPIFTFFLIIIGLIKVILFYDYFNIYILDYISLSESILVSIDVLIQSTFAFGIMAFF